MLRIVLAQPGPAPDPEAEDGSDPDLVVRLARALRDAGHEVVLTGPAATPEQVASVVVQEDVDAVVVLAPDGSRASGALTDLLAARGADDVDVAAPGAGLEAIIAWVGDLATSG